MTALIAPKAAAVRFTIPRSTLADWARTGLIGVFRVGRTVRYSSDEIQAVIDTYTTRRRVSPITVPTPTVDDDWRDSPLWRDTVAGRSR